MLFASDNWAGAAPEIRQAVAAEAERFGPAYGNSEIDRAVAARFSEIFEREAHVFFVATGSAANALALAAVSRPGGVVLCHREAHIVEDEGGAVEFLSGGLRLAPLPGPSAKLAPATVEAGISKLASNRGPSARGVAVSITQQNEAGAVYSLDEIAAIGAVAKAHGLALHMDGARFANALVQLGCSPAEMTWRAGVDLLSFGATKNGCIAADAVVLFDGGPAADEIFLRKRAGHVFSKSRIIAAQFDAYLRDGLWLRLAAHANAMAARLRDGLKAAGCREAWPTLGNQIFPVLRQATCARLRRAGATFGDWPTPADYGPPMEADEVIVRLVASFATTEAQVDEFVSALRGNA
jgi:threonine aldolase